MALNEQIVEETRYYRQCVDKDNKKWERYGLWNRGKDTECEDGNTVETKVGAIKGITTSTNVSETGYAADAKTVSEINQSLANGKIKFGIDLSGNYGYIKDGADTVIPFKNGKLKIWTSYDYDGSFLAIDDATEIQMVIAFISTNAERCEGRVNCFYKEENGNIFKRYDTNDLNIVVNGNTFKFNNPWFGQSQKMNIFVYYK